MNAFLLGLLKPLLRLLLNSEALHDYLRGLAKKTDNPYDDIAVEQAVAASKQIAAMLK